MRGKATSRGRLLREVVVQIGEIEAPRIDFSGQMGPISVAGQVTFIPHQDFVLRLMSVAVASAWSHYVGRAHTTARTFRSLTDAERDSVTVLHLQLVHALDEEDIASLSQRAGNAWGPGQTAVLNGVFVDRRFEEGEIVKIAHSRHYIPQASEAPRALQPSPDDPSPTPLAAAD